MEISDISLQVFINLFIDIILSQYSQKLLKKN